LTVEVLLYNTLAIQPVLTKNRKSTVNAPQVVRHKSVHEMENL